ncbi:hypothetical protein [uncultured Tateyamaria sp.]|uniref:hypothetical protein n=1 Tax=uncultured Tateyamaria sp. TaxID=455651 RepID=UPI00262F1DFE|nr:hypothetical protein [uncultured Tateyamaria sp.]
MHFESVREVDPDLAVCVEIVRSRVIELQRKFRSDADWALRKYNYFTGGTVFIAIVSILLGVSTSFNASASTTMAVSIAFATLAALVGAVSQAQGWHKRYAAMFAAAWALKGLRVKIDSAILNRLMAAKMSVEARNDAQEMKVPTEEWVRDLEKVLSSFGDEYGGSLSPPKIPNLR